MSIEPLRDQRFNRLHDGIVRDFFFERRKEARAERHYLLRERKNTHLKPGGGVRASRDEMDAPPVNKNTEYVRRWRAAHREEYLAERKAYNERTKEKRIEYMRAYRARKRAERPPPRTEEENKIVLVNLLDMLKDMLRRA